MPPFVDIYAVDFGGRAKNLLKTRKSAQIEYINSEAKNGAFREGVELYLEERYTGLF